MALADYIRWEHEHPGLTSDDTKRLMARGCANPNCGHNHDHDELLFLLPQCHPRGKLAAAYFRGSIYISRAACATALWRVSGWWSDGLEELRGHRSDSRQGRRGD